MNTEPSSFSSENKSKASSAASADDSIIIIGDSITKLVDTDKILSANENINVRKQIA